MLSLRRLPRRVLAHRALPLARVALPVHGSSTIFDESRNIMTEARLARMEELSEARQKLRAVLDDYRKSNYGQTLFSRFVKEMIIATDSNHDGKISLQEMRNMLKNIGADERITQEDLKSVFDEIGQYEDGEPLIYVDEIESILMQPSLR